MNWIILVIVLSSILLVYLLFKEVRRENKLSLPARILATLVSVVSLALIALPVTVKRFQKTSDASSAILVTNGYQIDSLQNFIKRNRGIKVFTADRKVKHSNAEFLPDLSILSEDDHDITTLHVFGYGLSKEELERIKPIHVVFHPSPILNKVVSVDWAQNIVSGEKLVVQGKFNNASSSEVKIILHAFDTNLDSALLPANKDSAFQLSTIPKHFDKAVYQLVVLSGQDTVESNPLPVEVDITRPLNVLVLANSPDFEIKFLRTWLAENGYGVAVRTYISKNKYDRKFVNLSSTTLGNLTASLLEKFDVVIADVAELNALSSADLFTLRSYIENKGIGLLVKASSMMRSPGFYLNSFPLIETRDSVQHTIKPIAAGLTFASSLKIQQPLYIVNRPGTEPLLTDQHRRTMASSKMLGLGRVVVTTIPNSYAWSLAGNKADFASYWTLMLTKAAKKNISKYIWQQQPTFSRQHFEVKMRMQTAVDSLAVMQVSGERLHPYQHPYLSYEWSSRYWPVRSGWHAISNEEQPLWMYVYNESDWQGISAMEKVYATSKQTGTSKVSISNKKEPVGVPVPKIYFMLSFVVAAGFLWFEKKYRNG